MIDVLYSKDGGPSRRSSWPTPGHARNLVRGLLHLLGFSYRPALADLPEQRLWRTRPDANYGPLNTAARGTLDLAKVRWHWPDILQVAAPTHTRAVREDVPS